MEISSFKITSQGYKINTSSMSKDFLLILKKKPKKQKQRQLWFFFLGVWNRHWRAEIRNENRNCWVF